MSRLTVNETMPEFTYETPFAKEQSFVETVQRVSGKTVLIFLRYYGCPICQFDLHTYAAAYEQIKATGGQLLIVLQSDPESLAQQITQETFPYDIICDPDKKLYQMLSIDPAASMLPMLSLSAVGKMIKATSAGYKHGAYEGDEQQLPATFIMTPELTLTYVRYGKDVGDVPMPAELVALMM